MDISFLYIERLIITRTVKFNWIISGQSSQGLKKRCIDLEYELRPKITKFLLERFENDCCGDFSCFHFDVDVLTKVVRISNKTPREFKLVAERDFDVWINGAGEFRTLAS